MSNPLAAQLIRMSRETIALKTAHSHGLGSMRLYSYTVSPAGYFDGAEFLSLTATVAANEPPFPIIDARADDLDLGTMRNVEISNDGMTYIYGFNADDGVNFKVVSSARLSNVEASWTS